VLAHSSGLEDRLRLRVDLAAVVNKYIGETEKYLRCVLDMAEGTDVILLFDEADVFFGRYTGVSDACDRCAKLKANYLLRLIEDCKGTVVLSTNLRESIDSAFPDVWTSFSSFRCRVWRSVGSSGGWRTLPIPQWTKRDLT
jgi:SpoVK/Ycf46/Vps4 family AAA+-type ATPase